MNGKDMFDGTEFLAVAIEGATEERNSSSMPVMGMNDVWEEVESL